MGKPTALTAQTWWPPGATEWPDADRARLARLDPEQLPRHVAIIMDGNGRWARQRGYVDRIRGHEAGLDSVREATRLCAQLRIDVLTLFAFSTENWKRPRAEVEALMGFLRRFLLAERDELMTNNIRLRTIGRVADLPDSARQVLDESCAMTAGHTGLTLNLALSYGARDELVRAVRRVAEQAAAGHLDPEDVDADVFSQFLDTADLPDPDLLIRTSGELRISNFLLWQVAYAEWVVSPVLWPDFRRPQLLDALIEFQGRERRYGMVS